MTFLDFQRCTIKRIWWSVLDENGDNRNSGEWFKQLMQK